MFCLLDLLEKSSKEKVNSYPRVSKDRKRESKREGEIEESERERERGRRETERGGRQREKREKERELKSQYMLNLVCLIIPIL